MNNSFLIHQLFTTMEYGPEQLHTNSQSQAWIDSHKGYEGYICGSLVRKTDDENCLDFFWYEYTYERHLQLISLSELITKKKEFVADVFMGLNSLYSRSFIMKSIQEIVQHINYFAQNALWSLKDKHFYPRTTQIVCLQNLPLRCISSVIIPALAEGFSGRIIINEDNMLYFIMLSDLCAEAGFKKGSLDLVRDKSIPEPKLRDSYPTKEVKMIIFEDSDLHSAIDCILDAIWNMVDKCPHLLVKVLVQESIFSEFKVMLKQRMVQNANTPIKYIIPESSKYFEDALNEFKSVVDNGFKSSYEVFQVNQSPMPATVLFNHQSRTSRYFPLPIIGVDVFRSESEALTMSNNNSLGQIASIWVESGSSARRIANLLEVDTVWINGYDLVHPISSALSLRTDNIYRDAEFQLINKSDSSEEQPQDLSLGQDIQKAWGLTEAAVLNWMKCKTKADILVNACKNMIASGKNQFQCFQEMFSLCEAIPALGGKNVSTEEAFSIEVMTRPRGIICIELSDKSSLSDSVYAIIVALAFGNCAFVSAHATLYSDLVEWSQCCKFPEGVVSIFMQCHPDCVSPIKSILFPLASVNFILWSLNPDLVISTSTVDFAKLFSELFVFCAEINIKQVQKISVQQIQQISTRPKFVWFPNL